MCEWSYLLQTDAVFCGRAVWVSQSVPDLFIITVVNIWFYIQSLLYSRLSDVRIYCIQCKASPILTQVINLCTVYVIVILDKSLVFEFIGDHYYNGLTISDFDWRKKATVYFMNSTRVAGRLISKAMVCIFTDVTRWMTTAQPKTSWLCASHTITLVRSNLISLHIFTLCICHVC